MIPAVAGTSFAGFLFNARGRFQGFNIGSEQCDNFPAHGTGEKNNIKKT